MRADPFFSMVVTCSKFLIQFQQGGMSQNHQQPQPAEKQSAGHGRAGRLGLVLYRVVRGLQPGHKAAIFLLFDMLLVPVCFVLALELQVARLWPREVLGNTAYLVFLLTIGAGLLSYLLGMHRIKLKAYETHGILKTGIFSVCLAVFGGALNTLAGGVVNAVVFVLFGMLVFLLGAGARLFGIQILGWVYRQGQHRAPVLIYGAGRTGIQLAAALSRDERIEPVAFIDDNSGLQNMVVGGLRVFSPAELSRLVTEKGIRRVLLAMPSESRPRQLRIARRLEKMGLDVQALPSFAQLAGEAGLVEQLAPISPSELIGRMMLDGDLPQVSDRYAGKSVMVTGAGGSIGSELCRQVMACGPSRLVLFEISEVALYKIDMELRALAEETGVQLICVLGSVLDTACVTIALSRHDVDIVLHAAAYKHVPIVEENELAGLLNNVFGTRVLAEAAVAAGVDSFVLISTDKAVRPTNIMGASKRMAELVIQDLAQRSVATVMSMVRFGNVLGSSGSVIPLFKDQISRGGPVTVTHPDVTRYFMSIPEAARLVLLAGSFAQGGDVFVLDMGKPVPILMLARRLIEASGYTVRDADNPDGDIEIAFTGLRAGEKLHEELLAGAGQLKTPHPRILRAQEDVLSQIEVASMLRDLNTVIEQADASGAREIVRRWVKGYNAPGAGVSGGNHAGTAT